MEPGTSKTVSFKVKVPEVDKASVWVNSDEVSWEPSDNSERPQEPSNEVKAGTPCPNLYVEKTHERGDQDKFHLDDNEVKVVQTVYYKILVENSGYETANNVVLTDPVPETLKVDLTCYYTEQIINKSVLINKLVTNSVNMISLRL